MAVLVVVPVDEPLAPLPRFFEVLEAFRLIVAVVFQGLEETLCVRVVVAYSRPAVRWGDAQVVKRLQHGSPFHGASVIGMEDKGLLAEPNPLGDHASPDQLAGMFSRFLGPDLPGDNLPTEEVREKIQVIEHPLDGTVQVGDVPHPDLVWACGTMGGDLSWLSL